VNEGALAGVRVLELAQGVAGPHCGHLFAQHGADVAKIEPPGGDWLRGFGPSRAGVSGFFLAVNGGKRSVCLDLKHAAGQRLALALARQADVLIDNSRPGVLDRLGLGHRAVAAVNPRIVYVAVSGFGQTGPGRARPAYDPAIQALTGFMSVNRDEAGQPMLCQMPLIDAVTGVYAFQAALAALFRRERGGPGAPGAFLDVSLIGAAAALQGIKSVEHAFCAGAPPASPSFPVANFATADGAVNVACVTDAHFRALAVAIGAPDLAADPRFTEAPARSANREALRPILGAIFRRRSTQAWLAAIAGADVVAAPVNDYAGFAADPLAKEAGLFAAFDQPGVGAVSVPRVPGAEAEARPCPAIGAHGRALLTEAGVPGAEIEAARAAGALTGL
jgi:crotonobetainyl-CoA:carnitine CoA-transferase CaiB-like acyl-CoA transferase